ncbi:hypothetical protein [Rodentibacter myodis]|uniref:Uncharacterized protein n=1 Tax=Rodentibacter myodis TaxID=1907939 RepID=A0A1V3JSR4_9PAST|nr:hypothetical protein [Rodentibacter myodis]OOF59742.1 hypothetical protein BKL49_02850 [Rodentibacter myodis]
MNLNVVDYLIRHKNERYIISAAVKKVSRNRLVRHIAFYINIDERLINISKDIANVIDEKIQNNGSSNVIVIKGCGSDMVFEILYRFFNRLSVTVPSNGIYTYQLI